MAVIWQRRLNATHYEVRSAGRSRRLYTDGVFHSQFNPTQPVTGGVWDLLMLPAFFYPAGTIQRILMLGVGGGTVIRQLMRFLSPTAIVGVELNPVHLYVARRFFGIAHDRVHLVEADGVEWLNRYQGPPFDLIIDDLFGERDGEPVRAVAANARWLTTLVSRLAPKGLLTANFASTEALRSCAYFTNARVRRHFKAAFQLSNPQEENAVGAFLRQDSDSRILRDRLKTTPGLDPTRKSSKLRYRIRRL